MSSPIGKGAVASRTDVGGGLGDIDPLTLFVFCNLCPGSLKDPDQRRLRGFSDDSASDFGLLSPQDAWLRHGCLPHCLAESMRLVDTVFLL